MSFAGFTSPIDLILKKDSYTLQELLDEDEVLVEVKKQKSELLAFLTKKENLAQIVSYIVDLPKDDAPEAVKTRYPVVCCELLACEDETIEKALFSDNQINRFFEFFSGTANILLSGVVIKVLLPLFDTQHAELLKKIQENPKWISQMLDNLQCPSVADFMVRLSQETPERSAQDWLIENQFTDKLFGKFAKANAPQHTDAANLALDVIGSLSWECPLLQHFQKSAAVLIQHIFEPGNDSGFKSGMRVFTKLLQRMSSWLKESERDEEEEEQKAGFEKPDLHGPLDKLPVLVQEAVKQLHKYPALLKTIPNPTKIKDQTGKTLEAFSFHRLHILEHIVGGLTYSALLDLGFSAVVAKVLDTEILNVSWDLLFKFDINPFCHRNVEKITSIALESIGSDSQIKLLKSTNLPARLIEAENAANAAEAEKKPVKAYLPFLHLAGNMLQLVGITNESVQTYLNTISGWPELSAALDAEKKRAEELMAARKIGGDDEANIFRPGQHYGDLGNESDAYTEGHDGDAEDLSLPDDVDMDSSNDFEDYDIDHAEVLLRKEEVEAFA